MSVACASDALALGSLGFESEGYLKNSPYRSNSSTWVTVEPTLEGRGPYLAESLDLKAAAFVSEPGSSLTIDSGDSYIATSPELGKQQLTLGRRAYDWSDGDRFWSMGLWQPRFLWDTFRPQIDGLAGVFYTYDSQQWRFLAYASPLTVPDRSYPVASQNGHLVAASNDWLPPYAQFRLLDRNVDIRYSLATPPLNQLLLNPGGGFSVRYDENDGRYARISTGLMPSHQLDLAAELGLNPSTLVMNATIHPRSYYHQLTTLEIGRHSDVWTGFLSMTRESPLQPEGPTTWLSQPMGPSWIASGGGSLKLGRNWSLSAGALWIDEDKRAPTPDEAALHLPPRFFFERATKFAFEYHPDDILIPSGTWTHDLRYPGNLMSVDLAWHPKWARAWRLDVGADFFSSASSDGFIGQYQGDDRVRVGVEYGI
jgi:hypothetical protein